MVMLLTQLNYSIYKLNLRIKVLLMNSKLKFIETSKLPTDIGEFTVHAFTDEIEERSPRNLYG